ncbi:MAG TPA: addiction module protein [Chitinophagaceae bacterium]|nr:addiction module protein [Chitinophagaceae bacterium]
MTTTVEKIVEEALKLPANKRASVADRLLSSLDTPDSVVDNLWKEEAEARILAAQKGEMDIIPEQEVFKKFE